MKKHILNGEIIIPREVYDELHVGNDDLYGFVKEHASVMVKDLDDEQVRLTMEILSLFPNLVDPNKSTPDADPYIVALARQKGWKVVTSEAFSNSPTKPKIPNVCAHYDILCISPIEFIAETKWDI
jgi:hypothetical protein